jgi:hypothetical protein
MSSPFYCRLRVSGVASRAWRGAVTWSATLSTTTGSAEKIAGFPAEIALFVRHDPTETCIDLPVETVIG